MMLPAFAAQPTVTQVVQQRETVPFHSAVLRPQQIAVSSINTTVKESYKLVT